MSWARMVVVAVRDPETGRPAARLARRLLLTAGFAAAAWLIGLVLGNFTASADETSPSPAAGDSPGLPEPQLVAALTGALGELNGLTHLSALTGSVQHVATQVTDTALAVVPQPDGATSPVADRSDTRPRDPSAPGNPSVPQSPSRAAPALPPVPVSAATSPQRAPAARTHPIVNVGARPAPPPREAGPQAASQQANGDTPVPSPAGQNDDHAIGVGAPHDAGGGKQPFVVPGARSGAADRRPAGPVTGGKVLAPARKAALPATSPD